MEVCGRWLPSGVPNCEQGKGEGNTAVTRLERTSPSVRVCVHTKLVKDLAKCSQQAAMGPPFIAEGCREAPAEAFCREAGAKGKW